MSKYCSKCGTSLYDKETGLRNFIIYKDREKEICELCYQADIIKNLKQQLAEKDKEIERLKDLNNFLTDQNKELILDMGTAEYFGDKWKIIEVLDQIEKGTDNE